MTLYCVMCTCHLMCSFFFFFKQKTAYEMRISDWSSDVCSSDLLQIYAPELSDYATDRIHIEENLRKAMKLGAFECHLQPKVRLVDRHWIGAEIGRASCRERVCQYV